jgi:hypothetical protein
MLENLKCYKGVRTAVVLFVRFSFPREAVAMNEADIATCSSATAVPRPLNVKEHCPFGSNNIAYSEYIAREREGDGILKCVRERSVASCLSVSENP